MDISNDYKTLTGSINRVLSVLATKNLHDMSNEERDLTIEKDRDRILELFNGFLDCCGNISTNDLLTETHTQPRSAT